MFRKNQKGFSLVEVLIIVGIIGILITVWVLSLNSKQAEIRDLSRLKDVNELRSAMEVVKNETGTYDRALCDLTVVSMCGQKSNSDLVKYLPTISTLNDPSEKADPCDNRTACTKDACNYSFLSLTENNYEVLFHLEKGANGFTESGCYKLTPQGVIKY